MNHPSKNNTYDGKIAGLYDLEDTLGRGHFAVVKLARHVFTGEKVAVKVIDKNKLDEVSRAHLFQEVRCMKLVQHPNVVRLYEVIDTQTKLYLILELGDGGDLYDYIMRHEKGLDEEMARKYFRQIVHAISYCHKLHVVHRDLKPENVVFFEKLGMVKLTDFGFSNKFCPGQKLETSCGSLAYSAPEILLGDSYDAPAVDVWSLGVILYMLVCGHAPFQEANDSETLTMIMDCKYTIPSNISKECKRLIARMLIRDPEERASLEEIAQDPWLNVSLAPIQPADYLPLVSREHLSDEDHQHIIQKLVNGGIATKEEILEALDKNSYDHITATYFLIAERKLRAQRQEQAQLINDAYNAKTDLSALAISPRAPINPTIPSSFSTVDSLLSPHDASRIVPPTSPVLSCTLDLPQTSASRGIRKCSIVEEEDEDACSEKSVSVCGDNNKSASSPSLAKDMKLELRDFPGSSGGSRSSSANSSPCASPSRNCSVASSASPTKVSIASKYKTLPSPNRKLHSVRSSPQLTLNEIYEEGESDTESSSLTGVACPRLPRSRVLHSHQSVASPAMLRKYEQRLQYSKSRTASCSSSDASDDDNDHRKRKEPKLKDIPKRDSYDDSSDGHDQDNSGGSSGIGGSQRSGEENQSNQTTDSSKTTEKSDNRTSRGSPNYGRKNNEGHLRRSKPDELNLADSSANRTFCKSASSPLNAPLFCIKNNTNVKESETFTIEISKLSLSEPGSPVLQNNPTKETKLQASLNILHLSGKDRVVPSCSRTSLGLGRILKQAPRFVSKRLDINQNGLKKKGRESKMNGTDLMIVSSSTSKCCSLS